MTSKYLRMPRSPTVDRLWTALLVTAATAQTVHPDYEADTFWHMSLGRAVLSEHRRVIPEPLALPAFISPAVVPEWLWDVITYGLFRAGSWPALSVFSALLAGFVAFLCVRLVHAVRPDLSLGAHLLVTGTAVASVISRLRLRPEAAGFAFLLAFLLLSHRIARAAPQRRLLPGLALAASVTLCAQVHGTFVLAPAVYLAVAGPTLISDARARIGLRLHASILAGVFVALTTSAYGLRIGSYISAHAHGDAVRYVGDMVSTGWNGLDPTEFLRDPFGTFLLIFWLLGISGMLVSRKLSTSSLTLAILGAFLAFDAIRFVTVGALLAIPLATEGAAALSSLLPTARVMHGLAAVTSVGFLVVAIHSVGLTHGPFGTIGPAEGIHPLAAARLLGSLPPGGRILSVYVSGGALGYHLAGHSRIYVDGRTPLYFDNTDFAISREVFKHPDALARAIDRFGATALVMERDRRVCGKVPGGWVAAVVESKHTTFVPEGRAPALSAIAPCGLDYFAKNACENVNALDTDIARLEALGSTPFVRYLKAERILRCGGALDQVAPLIPSRRDARQFMSARDGAEIAYLLRRGDVASAAKVVETAVGDDPSVVGYIAHAVSQDALPPSRARALLQKAIDKLADDAPPDLRAVLALTCAAEQDADCARFHGLRAAARGSRQSMPVLVWLRDHDPTPRGRADAAAWFAVLAAEIKREQAASLPTSASSAAPAAQPPPPSPAPLGSADPPESVP